MGLRSNFLAVLLVKWAMLATPLLAFSPQGFSDYIRSGLGLPHHGDRTKATGNTTGPEEGDLLECATSWASYSSQLSSQIRTVTITETTYSAFNTSLAYGTGDVYTTSAGIPVASGNFTSTRSKLTVYNLTATRTFTEPTTRLPSETPKCKFSPQDCSRLYSSYMSSLGLSSNASIPKITPAPTNSPPCPEYYYRPFSTCTWTSRHNYPNDCHIYGNHVQLFYFPTQTTNLSTASPHPTAPPLVYSWKPGTTFTSPSVYLSFDYLSAERLLENNSDYVCSTCDQSGCQQMAVDGGQSRNIEGTTIPGQLITMAPGEVKSVLMDYPAANASSIINVMAHGLPDYSSMMQDYFERSLDGHVTYKSLNFEDIIHPSPEAYYLQPTPASGCNYTTPDPQCSTIFEGQYRALISLPLEVTGLQGPWKSCTPVIYGVYDPPIALSEASTAAGITLPHGSEPTDHGSTGQPSHPPAAAPTLPAAITVPRTASPQATAPGYNSPPAESAILPPGGRLPAPDSSGNPDDTSNMGNTGNSGDTKNIGSIDSDTNSGSSAGGEIGSGGVGPSDASPGSGSPSDGSGQGAHSGNDAQGATNAGADSDSPEQDGNDPSESGNDSPKESGNRPAGSGASQTGVSIYTPSSGEQFNSDASNSLRSTGTATSHSGSSRASTTSSSQASLSSGKAIGWLALLGLLSFHVTVH